MIIKLQKSVSMQIIINYDSIYIILYIDTSVFMSAGPQKQVFALEHHSSAIFGAYYIHSNAECFLPNRMEWSTRALGTRAHL